MLDVIQFNIFSGKVHGLEGASFQISSYFGENRSQP